MDIERTIEFLVKNAAQSDARSSARMDRLEADLTRVEKGLKANKTLTVQLIELMSQQTAHHAKLARETERRFQESFQESERRSQETDRQIKATSEAVQATVKRIDAFLAASSRTNGHGKKDK